MNTPNNKRNNNKSYGNKSSKNSLNPNTNINYQEEYIELNEEESNSIEVIGVENSQDNTQSQNFEKLGVSIKFDDSSNNDKDDRNNNGPKGLETNEQIFDKTTQT